MVLGPSNFNDTFTLPVATRFIYIQRGPESPVEYKINVIYFPALRRLTEKARLLGYEVEVGMAGSTEARRKIAPNLTIEFVNYFNGR